MLLPLFCLIAAIVCRSDAFARPFRFDLADRSGWTHDELGRPQFIGSIAFVNVPRPPPSPPPRPDAISAIAQATGPAIGETRDRRPGAGVVARSPLLAACMPCRTPEPDPETSGPQGLVSLPGTPGLESGAMQAFSHAFLARRAFQHGCDATATPCTGFDATPPRRAEAGRGPQRLSLVFLAARTSRRIWRGSDKPPAANAHGYVDIKELIAAGQWHPSVLAPVIRPPGSDGDGARRVAIADAAPGRLDVGDMPEPDLVAVVSGWYRTVSQSELLALIALGACPVARRRRTD